jgi:hypothetical protein
MAALDAYLEEVVEHHPEEKLTTGIPQGSFAMNIRYNMLLEERALQESMTIPDVADFCEDVRGIYEATLTNRSGKAANYIPQLDLPEPEVDQYGVSLCTIEGKRFSIWDSQEFFSVQSTRGVDANPKDRWGFTPSDDALRHGQDQAATVLKLKGGQRSIEEPMGLEVS